jgi:uncharacterized protein DUF5996
VTGTGASRARPWPELPWHEWADTLATLHLWTQVVGKAKLAALPRPEHPWLVALAVTERGLTTSAIPYGAHVFAIDLDLADHRLLMSESAGGEFMLDLEPMTVAHFYRQVSAGLAELGIELTIRTKPYEIAGGIPFDQDEIHKSYDRSHVDAFLGGLRTAHRALEEYQHGFDGEAGPVVFYWGSFDVSTSRFAGATENACGWWPTDQRLGPAFYAYTKPAPAGFKDAAVRPAAARWDDKLGEFVLAHDSVRATADPDSDVREFLDTTWQAGQLKET